MSRPLVLLHGFTGAPASWDGVRRSLDDAIPVLAPALLGHDGTAGSPAIRSFDDEVDRLAGAVRGAGLEGAHLAGYSLGGRVALGLLVRHPGRFAAATLIGAHPGLQDPADRAERAARATDFGPSEPATKLIPGGRRFGLGKGDGLAAAHQELDPAQEGLLPGGPGCAGAAGLDNFTIAIDLAGRQAQVGCQRRIGKAPQAHDDLQVL